MNLFGKVNQQATTWVKDMMQELPTSDPEKAMHALRAGLHAYRDRLTVEEAAHLSAQLPLLIRGIFFEGWTPAGKPLRLRHKDAFLALIKEKYAPRQDEPPERIAAAVFRVLGRHVSSGEIRDVVLSLPEEIVEVAEGDTATD
jgi:uncharacterized protein (DUF2267 family)